MNTFWTIFLVTHFASAFVAYGLMLAFFQRKFDNTAQEWRFNDIMTCAIPSVLGGMAALISAIIVLFGFQKVGFKHGFLLWPENKGE